MTSTSILFGQTVPKTGPAALYGESTAGIQAYFDYVNAHGGVHGRKLKLISLNDQYEPPVALQATRTLVNTDNVFAEVGVNGTATTEANITVLDPANVPLVGPQTGATVFAGTLRKNLYNVWPSYLLEGKMLGSLCPVAAHQQGRGALPGRRLREEPAAGRAELRAEAGAGHLL